jgi:hypothetical protein
MRAGTNEVGLGTPIRDQIAGLIKGGDYKSAHIMRQQVEKMMAIAPSMHPTVFIEAWKEATRLNAQTLADSPTVH